MTGSCTSTIPISHLVSAGPACDVLPGHLPALSLQHLLEPRLLRLALLQPHESLLKYGDMLLTSGQISCQGCIGLMRACAQLALMRQQHPEGAKRIEACKQNAETTSIKFLEGGQGLRGRPGDWMGWPLSSAGGSAAASAAPRQEMRLHLAAAQAQESQISGAGWVLKDLRIASLFWPECTVIYKAVV